MTRSRSPYEVVAAWLLTGPAGHLYGGAADWVSLLVRYARAGRRWDGL